MKSCGWHLSLKIKTIEAFRRPPSVKAFFQRKPVHPKITYQPAIFVSSLNQRQCTSEVEKLKKGKNRVLYPLVARIGRFTRVEVTSAMPSLFLSLFSVIKISYSVRLTFSFSVKYFPPNNQKYVAALQTYFKIFQSLPFNKFPKTKLAIIKIIKVRERERERKNSWKRLNRYLKENLYRRGCRVARKRDGNVGWQYALTPFHRVRRKKVNSPCIHFLTRSKRTNLFTRDFLRLKNTLFFPLFAISFSGRGAARCSRGPLAREFGVL